MLPDLVCPRCRRPLEPDCPGCGTHYPRPGGVWDLAPWLDYVGDVDVPAHTEAAGEHTRADRYYLPLLRGLARATGRGVGELRVLDDGCGFGAGVDRLAAAGLTAVGIDVGFRRREWSQRTQPDHFLRADGRALPFPDATFDAVVSFGVLEHVGIEGESGTSEQVAADYREQRARYVAEALRVTRAPGLVLLSQPNGACPIDFWHYSGRTPMRFHNSRQPFLPRFSELREWAHAADPDVRVHCLSPDRVLALQRIGAWGPGRLLTGAMRAWLSALTRPRLARARSSALNPFLAVVLEKR